MTYIFGTLLTANGNMRLLNLTAAVGIAVNLAVNFVMIPRFHACGAAAASLCTQTVMAAIQTVIAFKETPLSLKEIPFMKALVFTGILIPFTYFFSQYYVGKSLVALLICGTFACLLGFATRLIPVKFWQGWR